MTRDMLEYFKLNTTKEGLPVFLSFDAITAALGKDVKLDFIPMNRPQAHELIVANTGISISCTDEQYAISGPAFQALADKLECFVERCDFSDPRSGAKLRRAMLAVDNEYWFVIRAPENN